MSQLIDQIMRTKGHKALPIMTHPGIEHLGKTVKDAVTDGNVHFQAIQYLSEHYPSMACTTIMDLTLEAEAFGASIHFPEDEVPSITAPLVTNADEVAALQVPDLTIGRMPQYLLANRLAVEHSKDKPILSGCIGPFSLAGRLYDMSEIMIAIYLDPDTIHALLEKCTQYILSYVRALKAIGTSGVIMAEPAAGLLSNDDCMIYSTPYVKRIVEELQDDAFTVVLHNCGNSGHCTEAMLASGAKALHFGNRMDILEALKLCPPDILVLGNLDPVGVFKQLSADQVYAETKALLSRTAGYPNFVVSSGCDLPPHVPQENIEAFFRAVKE